ncbi:hypothetical protein J2X16_004411 [Pelomonas aquatica]|uniref:Uncharacterized protein n=1 Tax=Pelomonas aquatica TaxID=431058 RepID=A0ABU1ZEJ8_9BURK|nr:hypothetical protein [Pelomonas aquatica]
MRGAFAKRVAPRCIAGSPARRRGNFLLRGQKKVTKEEALNRTRASRTRVAPRNSRSVTGQTRPAALSLLSLSPASLIATSARLTRGCTPCSRGIPKTASLGRRNGAMVRSFFVGWGERSEPQHRAQPQERRPSDAAFASAGELGVQPALTGVKGRWMVLVTGTAARAQRVASGRQAAGRFRAPLLAASRWRAVQGLFFGDFLLAPQKKVTPPPGGTPGNRGASPFRQEATH